jgi:predicted nucleic acid-binding Zn ribbon protein
MTSTIRAHRVGWLPRNPEPGKFGPKPKLILGPNLPNAACKHLAPLFDDTIPGETDPQRHQRHNKAQTICRTCPAKTQCQQERETNPDLGPGIYGGQLYENTKAQQRLDRLAKRTPKNRQCKNCGQTFPAVTRRVYCGDNCYEQARAAFTATTAHTRRALPQLTHCQDCDKPLPPGRKRNCSDQCRKRGSEHRRQATKHVEEAA